MPIILPAPKPPCLSTGDAIEIAKRARKLLRQGHLKHRQYVLLDCLMWSCRAPGTGLMTASYTTLQRLTKVCRDVIAEAIRVFEKLGLLNRNKRRVRVHWHQGGTASRQITSQYILKPARHTESAGRTVYQTMDILSEVPTGVALHAREALADRRRKIEARMLNKTGAPA